MPPTRCASQDLITVRASALSPVPAGVTHAAPDRWHVRVVLLPGMPGTQTVRGHEKGLFREFCGRSLWVRMDRFSRG